MKNFQELIRSLVTPPDGTETVGKALLRAVTLGGRVELSDGLDSLNPRDEFILDEFGALPFEGTRPSVDEDRVVVSMLIEPYGRVRFRETGSPMLGEEVEYGFFKLSSAEYERMRSVEEHSVDPMSEDGRLIENHLSGLSDDEHLAMVDSVYESVDHIDPVLIYVGAEVFTLFGKHNNLIRRGEGPVGILDKMRLTSVSSWSWSEKVFLFLAYAVAVSGCRLEEFNGKQLGARSVSRFLVRKISEYAAASGSGTRSDVGSNILDLAVECGRLRLEVSKKHRFYRRVNGLTFHKSDYVDPSPARAEVRSRLYQGLQMLQSRPTAQDAEEWCRCAVVDCLESSDFETEFAGLLAGYLGVIADLTHSDVALSRTPRDYSTLFRLGSAEFCREISELPVSAYACCAIPGSKFVTAMQGNPSLLQLILSAISKRMEYNSWHYAPGYFPRDSVPEGRHFYSPPSMPDTSTWSNLHHPGHVMAGVKFSIRSPGVLEVRGRKVPGLFDIRLMRQTGIPYTDQDLVTTVYCTNVLAVVHQDIINFFPEKAQPRLESSFSKEWHSDCVHRLGFLGKKSDNIAVSG